MHDRDLAERVVAAEQVADAAGVADQDDADAVLTGRGHGAGDHLLGGLVAAHRVDRDPRTLGTLVRSSYGAFVRSPPGGLLGRAGHSGSWQPWPRQGLRTTSRPFTVITYS
ncbi:hypothetical protein GCM10010151_68450 [Actinoallomurus spadix]|uniref:Uncharacterized protein n=1 Tax=Actinoallomurus spadix TaxID=79912 RepID=A0ABN0XNV9_9ACTN